MTTPLTALTDPESVEFELAPDADVGFTPDEAYALLIGDRSILVADATFEKLHPRDGDGRFTDSLGDAGAAFAARLANALTGEEALDAAPAKLTPAPKGHRGNYEGEKLDAPAGAGSVRALSRYEGVEYERVNTFLRGGYTGQGGPGRMPSDAPDYMREAADIAAEIDKTLNVSPLKSDVRVERVVKEGDLVFGRDAWYGDMNLDAIDDFDEQDRAYERWVAGERPNLTGLRWRDDGYQSTTASSTVAPEFGERWVRLRHPGDGEPVIMTILVPRGTRGVRMSGMDAEAEILLERGLTMEIVADNGVDDKGFRRLDVRVVPSDEV